MNLAHCIITANVSVIVRECVAMVANVGANIKNFALFEILSCVSVWIVVFVPLAIISYRNFYKEKR